MQWMEYLRELNFASMVLRTLLSMLIGGILGLERGRKKRPAGFRTYMLVCFGSALVMMTNQYVFAQFNVSDPVRMGAQVVSGIGFLGAGTIIVTGRNQVKGITTAAGLWTAACCGLAIGIGFYEGALIAAVAVYIIMGSMQRLDDYIHNHTSTIEVYLEYTADTPFRNFLEYAREKQFEINDIQISKNKFAKDNTVSVILLAKSLTQRTHSDMVDILSSAPGIHYLEEI